MKRSTKGTQHRIVQSLQMQKKWGSRDVVNFLAMHFRKTKVETSQGKLHYAAWQRKGGQRFKDEENILHEVWLK